VLLLQVLINGLLLGGLYGIMALGMSLIWGVMNIVNVAHGALIMLGAYLTFWMFTLWGIDPFASLPLTIASLFVYGYCLQRWILNLVVRAQLFLTLLITFGVEVVLTYCAQLAFSADFRTINPPYAGENIVLGPVTLPVARLAAFGVALALTVGMWLFLLHTRLGRAIRATSEELRAARLTGIPVAHIYAVTFGLGAALAGAAGGLWGMLFPITPVMGGSLTLKSFVVAVLGGLGTMLGALVGGLVLGLAESVTATYLGPTYPNAISFALLVLILIVRPTGILGRRT